MRQLSYKIPMVIFLALVLQSCSSLLWDNWYDDLESAHDVYEIAANDAQLWMSSAQLIEVTELFDLRVRKYGGAIFRYESLDDNKTYLEIFCINNTCSRSEYFSSQNWISQGWEPITFESRMIKGKDALVIALEHGGEDFLDRKNVITSARLGRDNPRNTGRIVWFVFFGDNVTGEQLRVTIDPFSGNVIRVE